MDPCPAGLRLAELVIEAGEEDIDTGRLFDQFVVDKGRLRAAVQRTQRRDGQVTLRELVEAEPLQQGLAELIAYLELAHGGGASDTGDGLRAVVDETVEEPIRWQARDAAGEPVERCARLPRVMFVR